MDENWERYKEWNKLREVATDNIKLELPLPRTMEQTDKNVTDQKLRDMTHAPKIETA